MATCRLLAAAVVTLSVMAGVAVARVPEGRIFVLHSQPAGACPALDWHIVVEANGVLAGMIAWDNMKSMARATGRIDQEVDTFTMTAVEVGGRARRVAIDGRIDRRGWIIANLKGPQIACTAVIVPPSVAASDVK
jgi:hypothetical protein